MERNNVPVPPAQLEYIDSVITPFWPGTGPFNSVKVVPPSPLVPHSTLSGGAQFPGYF